MNKQTAAEKFDKAPPWCVLGAASIRHIESRVNANHDGTWREPTRGIPVHLPEDLARIARLTRPLDSWEPKGGDPLPVEGWEVRRCATGPGWFVAALGDNSIFSVSGAANKRFDTRRAACVWAWTEAEAPDDAKPRPITEADVKVGAMFQDGDDDAQYKCVAINGACAKIHKLMGDTWCNLGDWQIGAFVRSRNDFKARLITDDHGAKDGPSLESRVAKVEGVLARIGSMESFVADAQALADRMTIVERLVAGLVPPITPGRNDAAAANALATDVAAADEGWREMLVRQEYGEPAPGFPRTYVSLETPDRVFFYNPFTKVWAAFDEPIGFRPARYNIVSVYDIDEARRTCPPPPNLAEWYKPGAKADDEPADRTLYDLRVIANQLGADMPTAHAPDCLTVIHAKIASIRDAVPSTHRVGDDLAAWVRNLASAHDTALKDMAGMRTRIAELERSKGDLAVDNAGWMRDADNLRTQLAAAQTAATAAEGRAATALRRATAAEQALADFRIQLGEVLK